MDNAQKLLRSKSSEKIDFTKIKCLQHPDRLVRVHSTDTIMVAPIWEIPGDDEGQLYAAYRAQHPEYDGVYIRSAVLQRLEEAAKSLNGAYKLVLHAGHRPIGVQKQLSHDVTSHCCGAAVDVELFDVANNRLVDFGSKINENADISHLHAENITLLQGENRLRLLKAMLDAGFASYYAEWWHYSYGDEVWAWFYGKDACLYGLAEL